MDLDIRTTREICEHKAGGVKELLLYEQEEWVNVNSLALWLIRMCRMGHDEAVISALFEELKLTDNDYQ